jgi:hypothetical protein
VGKSQFGGSRGAMGGERFRLEDRVPIQIFLLNYFEYQGLGK